MEQKKCTLVCLTTHGYQVFAILCQNLKDAVEMAKSIGCRFRIYVKGMCVAKH